jgi:hypothetical protein
MRIGTIREGAEPSNQFGDDADRNDPRRSRTIESVRRRCGSERSEKEPNHRISSATMQWGTTQPRSGEGDEAMRRSGARD